MQEKPLVIVLADISGYTRFMLENHTSAVHGQICINSLIESIVREVDIPLVLQEIEGDAVFLYAAHPGDEEGWRIALDQVGAKLERFFAVFLEQMGIASESTPCGCAICRNADALGLKIIVHAGRAVFHEVAGRPQVSGSDVILAHRLLKNSIEANEYLLVTEPAFAMMQPGLEGSFESRIESCEGFGDTPVRVRTFEREFLAARDAVYAFDEEGARAAALGYRDFIRGHLGRATWQQVRRPIRPFGWFARFMMVLDAFLIAPVFIRFAVRRLPNEQRARGRRRERADRPAS